MDAFVVRTPRRTSASSPSAKAAKKPKQGQKQTRLNDLKGVVVLEDITEFVTQLQSQEVCSEAKREILRKLVSKQPSTEIIVRSGIGKVVQTLMKCTHDPDLAKAAREVKTRWRNLIERRVELSCDKNKPEVATDLQTRITREKALSLFIKKFAEEEVPRETLKSLEKRLFARFRPVIGIKYRRTVRQIVIHSRRFEADLKSGDLDKVVEKAVNL